MSATGFGAMDVTKPYEFIGLHRANFGGLISTAGVSWNVEVRGGSVFDSVDLGWFQAARVGDDRYPTQFRH